MVGKYVGIATAGVSGVVLAGAATAALAAHPGVTRSRAKAVATAINLRHADFPDFVEHPADKESAADKRRDAALSKCIGESPASQELADVSSPTFAGSGGSLTLSSETEILRSAAAAAKDATADRQPRALGCLRSGLHAAFGSTLPDGERLSSVSIARLSVGVTGADSVSAYRFTGTIHVTAGGRTANVPIYVDLVSMTYGQAEFGVTIAQPALKPPVALDAHVATLVVSRARSVIG